MTSIYRDEDTKPPLDEQLYSFNADEIAFLKSQTGIDNDKELKDHILSVQAKAYKIYGYPCIRRFGFAKARISHQLAYSHVLNLGQERVGAILLDIGCGFGNDVRKVISDGYLLKNIIASDLRQEFWDLGHDLFKTTAETFPVPFIAGDVFDPSHLASGPPCYDDLPTPTPHLKSLTSLTPLHGHISAIHATSFFHLFSEEKQLKLAQALASLLSPLPGSVIFGSHIADPEMRMIQGLSPKSPRLFCHSPDSWRKLWDGGVFKKDAVHVETQLKEVTDPGLIANVEAKVYLLLWSVTRL